MFDNIKRIVGLNPAQGRPAPHYRVLADGIIVTDDRASVWMELAASPTQTASPTQLDAELRHVVAQAQKTLADHTCHLKIVWGRITSDEYQSDAKRFTMEDAREWARLRAESIDSWELPERHVLLGVEVEDRTTSAVVRTINNAADFVRGDRYSIPERELAWLDQQMRSIVGRVHGAPWRARPAPVEVLAWLIGRESFRTNGSIPTEGTIQGAPLARLARGRIVPFRDHLRFYDATGNEVAYSAALVVSQFPEAVDTNGTGQWLLSLSSITRPAEGGDIQVLPEASIRFEFLSQAHALTLVNKSRKRAKAQRREAAESAAEETSEETQVAEEEMRQLGLEIGRGRTRLVQCWPILAITEPSLEDLYASIDAVVEAYAEKGITLDIAADEQDTAWLSTLAADEVRIKDMQHTMDAEAFFGSWFWGGSVVGDEEGPVIGYTTGATRGLVHCHPTEAPLRGDTTTVAILGRSGRGKTTAVQLMALDAAAEGAWVPVLDLKGDLNNEAGGLVGAAGAVGIPARRIDMTRRHAGVCDLLANMDPEDAQAHAHAQLMLLISDHLRMAAHPVLMEHIAGLLADGGPRSAHALILRLEATEDDTARRIARELRAFEADAVGRMIVGERSEDTLDASPGITLIQFPKLDLPPAGTPAGEWSAAQRVSAALVRGALSWIMSVARTQEHRHLRKLVAVPEAHLLTATAEGAAFLDQTARLGRALGTTLVIDSQDPTSFAERDGIMEQIATVMAFSQSTVKQQDAMARVLGMEPSDQTRAMIETVSIDPDGGGVWHGHCLMRDHRGRVATVQVAIPGNLVRAALDTTPKRTETPHEHDVA